MRKKIDDQLAKGTQKILKKNVPKGVAGEIVNDFFEGIF